MLRLLRTLDREDGAEMVEYAFLLLGIALVVVVAGEAFGIGIAGLFARPLAWLP